MLTAAPSSKRQVFSEYPSNINSNSVTVTFDVSGEPPESVAIDIHETKTIFGEEFRQAQKIYYAERKTNQHARLKFPSSGSTRPGPPKWIPFRTNLLVDLGPGEGERSILFAYKYKDEPFNGSWNGSSINIHKGTPSLTIVNPTNLLVSQPMIQLQGLTSTRFEALRFERYDVGGNKFNSDDIAAPGLSFLGGYPFAPNDYYFTFLDVDLSPGPNKFVFYGKDEFGNEMMTNVVVTFSIADDHTPPIIKLNWPAPNMEVSGTEYTVRGRLDDFTAKLKASIRTTGTTTKRDALVERNGYFWFEHLPLAPGINQITLTAVDAAGNLSETNFAIVGVEGPIITMDDVNPPELWHRFIQVTGQVSPVDNNVWINGVQAKVKPDGTWLAERVPVLSPNGGTACFEISATPISHGSIPAKASQALLAQATLGTNAMVLNASSPACGMFRLHVSDTAGKSFVILASTNLSDWTPILTNSASAASFDYTVDTTGDPCRFFKIVPQP